MINILRKIRRQFLENQNARKYFLYALGEIILIVVGILIALQINNWNIDKKNQNLEKVLLRGIQADLAADTLQINGRFYRSYYDLEKNIAIFDSIIKLDDTAIDITYLDSIFNRCIRQRNTFWPTSGTYNSIVNNGNSVIFQNKELYKGIQNLYDKTFKIVLNSGHRIDDLSAKIRYEKNFMNVLSPSEKLDFYRNPNTRNEIDYWFNQLSGFESNLAFTKRFAQDLIIEIEKEIVK